MDAHTHSQPQKHRYFPEAGTARDHQPLARPRHIPEMGLCFRIAVVWDKLFLFTLKAFQQIIISPSGNHREC